MKIEKINDNQIRCTLTRADLADREIKLSELVSGTEKAKSLFQDMMKQASSQFGFEAEDMPLMIEAIPAPSDSVVLIITKVDDPEEIDHKFSKYNSAFSGVEDKKHPAFEKLAGAEDVTELLEKIKDAALQAASHELRAAEDAILSQMRLFSFPTLDCVIDVAHLLNGTFQGESTLYKDVPNDVYLLALLADPHTSATFNKVCNMLSEYGCAEKVPLTVYAFLDEHCEVIIPDDALQLLGEL